MKNVNKYMELVLHLFFWGLLVFIAYYSFSVKVLTVKMGGEVQYTTKVSMITLYLILIDAFFKIIFFYTNSFVLLPRYLRDRKRSSLIEITILFLLTFGVGLLLSYVVAVALVQAPFNTRLGVLLGYAALFHLLILFLSIGYRLAKDWVNNEKVKKEIEEENLRTELDFLKSQINPHFLFNTLNNLYAEARKYDDKTVADGIVKLSHMMRYMIYDSNVELVSLDKEIEYLKSYIALQKLRLSPEDPFDFKIDIGEYEPGVLVVPILFMPFVENAFKHGLSLEEESYIHIWLSIESQLLIFKVENSKSSQVKLQDVAGVGLKNIQRRLELLYKNEHELLITEGDKDFSVLLKIKFA